MALADNVGTFLMSGIGRELDSPVHDCLIGRDPKIVVGGVYW
jgi:hypothetical protein